jgi:hypothetical protein
MRMRLSRRNEREQSARKRAQKGTRRPAGICLLCLASALGAAGASARSITGICPDGSVFVVQQREQIPCDDAKEIQPHEVPPLRPELLPTPYTWQIYNETQNPNNPYHMIDAARAIREMAGQGASGQGASGQGAAGSAEAGAGTEFSEGPGTAPLPGAAAAATGPIDLGLGDDELRDLFLLVELSQEQTPARFARETADGRELFEVSLARSEAFSQRLREAWASRGGLGGSQVLLFTSVSKQPAEFQPNLTFVQGHLSYQPAATNPRQLGILQGHLGALEADELVLGYVILPETLDLDRPVDVYWNDRRLSVQF